MWWVSKWGLNVAFVWMERFEASEKRKSRWVEYSDWFSSVWLLYCLKRVLIFVAFLCRTYQWPSPVGWSGLEYKKEWIVHLLVDCRPCCVPRFSSKAFANFPTLPLWASNAGCLGHFSLRQKKTVQLSIDRRLVTAHDAIFKRTAGSSGTLRRLEAVGISLRAVTWHSFLSVLFFLLLPSLSLCPHTGVQNVLCILRKVIIRSQHHSKNQLVMDCKDGLNL